MTPAPLAPGLWVILTTPFVADGALDLDSMRSQVRFACGVPADGLVALGVFGEAASLSLAEQRVVAEQVAADAGEVPLVLGISGRSTAVAVEQATSVLAAAIQGGADAGRTSLMVQIHAADPALVVRHLTAVHEETGAGIVLQDYPLVSGVRMPVRDVAAVVAQCPFVVAVKAEAPPTPPAIRVLTGGSDVPVFGGLGGVGLVDELATGAAGAMTGFSHPEGLRATIDAFARGGFEAAREAWAPWLPLACFEAQQGISLSLRKILLHRRGILAHPDVRPPAPVAPSSLSDLLDQHLATVPTTPPTSPVPQGVH